MIIDNLIIINGGAYNEIKKTLKQWIDIYSDKFTSDFTFELYKNGRGKHIIKADPRLDNDLFYYLVNYLKYPEGVDYKIDLEGFVTVKDNSILNNQKLLVYISSNDTEYDNVFAVSSDNINYKIDFGGKVIVVNENRQYIYPDNISFDNPEFIKINKKEISQQSEENSKDKVVKRFNIISKIAFGLFCFTLLTWIYDIHVFIKVMFFYGMGLGLWFFLDYIMLRIDKYYYKSLAIGVSYLFVGLFLNEYLADYNVHLVDFGALYPLSVLIVQWPVRRLYLLLLKREPVVDKHGSFPDLIYTLILFLSFAVLPFLIMDAIK